MQRKIQQNLAREMQVRATQAKAALEREENRRKLSHSKRSLSEHKRELADQKKDEARLLHEVKIQGQSHVEHEKRLKAEEERKRLVYRN